LADDQIEITADKISALLSAANVEVESYWPGLFAKAVNGIDVKAIVGNVGVGSGSAPAAGGAAASGEAPAFPTMAFTSMPLTALADDQIEITADKISALLSAANVEVESYWPGLFAKAVNGIDVKAIVGNVGVGSGSAPAAGGAAASGEAPAEEAKEEVKE